jgi:hypothetical protein
MIARLLPRLLVLALAGAVLLAYRELPILRGTLLWELRFVVLTVGIMLVFSLLDALLSRLLPPPPPDPKIPAPEAQPRAPSSNG